MSGKGMLLAGTTLATALVLGSCSLLFDAATSAERDGAPHSDGRTDAAETLYEEAVRTSEPDAYYRGDERFEGTPVTEPVSGLLAVDQTQNFPGSYLGDIEFEILGAIRGGRAFRVRESADSKLVPPRNLIDLETDFTIELLFRSESTPMTRHGGIFVRETFEQSGFRFGVYSTDSNGPLVFKLWCDESGCVSKNTQRPGSIEGMTAIEPRRWYHVVLTHVAETHLFSLYVDGRDEFASELPVVTGSANRFQTGFGCVSGKRHDASFDEIAVYRRVMGGEERLAHYDAFVNSR